MILKRRERPPFWARLREIVWPRKGWWRPGPYLVARLRRLPGSPHGIALGFACGVAVSFTPLLGLHLVLAAGLAWAVRANVAAALLGTLVANPLTFPLIVAVALGVGRAVLGTAPLAAPDAVSLPWVVDNLGLVFWPWLAGGGVAGGVCGAAAYWLIRPAVAAYRAARIARLARAAGGGGR